MTRAELEQVKAALSSRPCCTLRTDCKCPTCIAEAILDREMAAPEVREWRVASFWQGGSPRGASEFRNRSNAEAWLDHLESKRTHPEQVNRLESRIPAGPWEIAQ